MTVTETSATATPEGAVEQAALRRDIRELGVLLGRTLVRQEGRALLDLVERVRLLIREDRDAAAAELAALEPATARRLVRAFGTYFHLANVAEQVHRGRELAVERRREGAWLAQAVERIAASDVPREELVGEVRRLALRPVFTAHPTEAARRTVLRKLREVADLLDAWEAARGDAAAERRVAARLEELIDLLWQTDELRIARPDVVDEARNAVYYLDALFDEVVPDVLEALAHELERLGCGLAPDARPLAFGSWIGGDRDGNPNVSPDSTRRVLGLQHEHGIRCALSVLDELRVDLSSSMRIVGATPELERSLAADLDALPEIEPRYRRMNAEEPYRLKVTCMRQKLLNTRARLIEGRPHRPGYDYAGSEQLVAELMLVRDSLLADRGGLIARSRRSGSGWRRSTCASTRARTTTRSGSWSTGSLRRTARRRTPSSTARSAARCWGRSSARAGRSRPARRRSTPPARARSTPSARSARGRSATAPMSSSPTSSRCARGRTTCWPPPCSRARRACSTSTRASRGSASCRCWRRSRSCRRRGRCSRSCSSSPPTAGSSRCAATCRR